MRPLLVCGNANVETVLRLEGALLPGGGPVLHALSLNVSGVGVNLACGLTRLGSPVRLLTALGSDPAGRLVRAELDGIELHVFASAATSQTLTLVQPGGAHTFYRDLKSNHDLAAPREAFGALLPGSAAALLTNIGWTRALLPIARAAGVPILTDVHDLAGLDQPYDQPFFEVADVLLLSAARLADPVAFVQALAGRTRATLIVASLGEDGAPPTRIPSDRRTPRRCWGHAGGGLRPLPLQPGSAAPRGPTPGLRGSGSETARRGQ